MDGGRITRKQEIGFGLCYHRIGVRNASGSAERVEAQPSQNFFCETPFARKCGRRAMERISLMQLPDCPTSAICATRLKTLSGLSLSRLLLMHSFKSPDNTASH